MKERDNISLKGSLISLRGMEPDDVDKLYLWENDARLWPYGSTNAPLTRHMLWQYAERYCGDIFADRQLRLIITENATGEAVGTIDFYDFEPRDRRACMGIFIDEPHRRRGYASQALNLAMNLARNSMGMHQLAAFVAVNNTPSINLFKSAGFKSHACLQSWLCRGKAFVDVLVFQHFLND